ncbi:hypothetical protein MtrunA17_Chr5g0401221 [Medicago truncatula]|uniref:Uncharacterized protein n=1 Tax=Medicago truncatula TaxID=3880 RepID=A0A396HKQ7_MEDTR|nr:hypothetical protein MtrunA17_Chr5g0401221 [Medicago truncatula]
MFFFFFTKCLQNITTKQIMHRQIYVMYITNVLLINVDQCSIN